MEPVDACDLGWKPLRVCQFDLKPKLKVELGEGEVLAPQNDNWDFENLFTTGDYC